MIHSRREARPSQDRGSAIDALNQTIDALERRLDGMMDERLHRPVEPPVAPARQSERTGGVTKEDAVALIRERQRRLDALRNRWANPTPRTGPAAVPTRAPAETPTPRAEEADADSDLREVAQALVALRRELRGEIRRDLGDDLTREMSVLRAELKEIRELTTRDTLPDSVREELVRLGNGIEAVRRAGAADDVNLLRGELDELRQRLGGLAREDTLRELDGRWAEICDMMAAYDPVSMGEALSGLNHRLNDIASAVAMLPEAGLGRHMEEEMEALAAAVDRLAHQTVESTHARDDIAHLNERLDEIGRAIAASHGAEKMAVERIDDRLNEIGERFADLNAHAGADMAAALAPQLDTLTRRIAALADNGNQALAERLDALAGRIADGVPSRGFDEVAVHLEDLVARIDGLNETIASSQRAPSEAFLDRFEALVDRAERRPPDGDYLPALEGLQRQLSDITDKLETPRSEPALSDDTARGLEAQILRLCDLVTDRASLGEDGLLDALEPRLTAIESRLAHSQEDMIAAATHAAEVAIASVLEGESEGYEGEAAEISAIAGFSEDLRALQQLTRASEERSSRTFEALHDTLIKIADRLESMDRTSRQPHFAAPASDKVSVDPVASDMAASDMAEDVRLDDGASTLAVSEQFAGAPVMAASAGPDDAELTQSRSFLGRLADRVGARKQSAPAADTRMEPSVSGSQMGRHALEPTPPIDPSETLDPKLNEPLEPGSGRPDIGSIMKKVREQQTSGASRGTISYSETEKADFIAAARRAAQAAAAEVESTNRGASGKMPSKPGTALSNRRRPILLAIGAVLLVVMSYPLVSGLMSPPSTPPVMTESAPGPDPLPGSMADADDVPPAAADGDETGTTVSSTAPDAPSLMELQSESVLSGDVQAGQDGPGQAAFVEPEDDGAAGSERAAAFAAMAEELPAEIGPIALVEAAGDSDPAAMFEIGARFTAGRGVEIDHARAAEWYLGAAEEGLAPAQYRLGNFYEQGTGVERDLGEARRWYEAAAAGGNANAMHNLAVLHASGATGAAPDYERAADWFLQAAEHGVRDSQFNLAVLFARGSGVEQDLAESYKWFAVAAEEGDADAASKRDEVANVMESDELARARAEVELWQPRPLDPAANNVDVPEMWSVSDTRTATVDMAQAVRNVQIILNQRGFDAGAADGVMGVRTAEAVRAFQIAEGLEPTGRIDDLLVRTLIETSSQPS